MHTNAEQLSVYLENVKLDPYLKYIQDNKQNPLKK